MFPPISNQPSYVRAVAAFRPEKDDPRRIRWTAGGNRVYYDGSTTSTKTADLTTVKILANSISISTKNGRFATIDLKDFYLGMPMQPKDFA
jgi:hypothetical protein